MIATKKFLWPHELGREVGISSATVRRLADSGAGEVLRDAKGRRRFKPEAIEALRKFLGLQEGDDGSQTTIQN